MRFKAVLVGALVRPFGKGDKLPWQTFQPTQMLAEDLGKEILRGLREDEQKTAYVKVMEITEVLLSEVHVAAEQPKDAEGKQVGPLAFAIARHGQKVLTA